MILFDHLFRLRGRHLVVLAAVGGVLAGPILTRPAPGAASAKMPSAEAARAAVGDETEPARAIVPVRFDPVALRRAALPGPYRVEVLRVVDGDTFEGRVRIWFGQEITTLIRLRGIDAPEMKARCPDELRGAEAARAAFTELLSSGPAMLTDVGPDKYNGRVLASVFIERQADKPRRDVAAAMLASNHARPYRGGRRRSWCEAETANAG